jgi:uncharacterized membrane protein (DUF106 family)
MTSTEMIKRLKKAIEHQKLYIDLYQKSNNSDMVKIHSESLEMSKHFKYLLEKDNQTTGYFP